MKVLIDTCVILDSIQSREPFAAAAEKIFLAAANDEFEGFITANSCTDIYYIINRSLHSKSKSREVLSNLFIIFNVLKTTAADCKLALSSDVSDYEDAVMVETAIRSGIDCIVTRNIKDYILSPITVYEPLQFLELLQLELED